MISTLPNSYNGAGGSRRARYSRSRSNSIPPSKRSKLSSSNDRNYGNDLDSSRHFTSICVSNINPRMSDSEIRDYCNKTFSRFGLNSVKIYHRNQERVAYISFPSYEDARKARNGKAGIVWGNMQVHLEPIYSRTLIPPEQLIRRDNSRERSRRRRRATPPLPSPQTNSYHNSSTRHRRNKSPLPSRSTRASRRNYSPYIPLPPDLVNFVKPKSSGQRKHSSSSTARRHHHNNKETSRKQRSRTPSSHHSESPASSSHRTNEDDEQTTQNEPARTLHVENLDRNITESKLEEVFGRYGTIKQINLKKSSSKRAYAFIQYENVDMAYEARRAMDGKPINKIECKIGYGKSVPSKYLWVGNITFDIKRRDLEHAFARYGQIKKLDYSAGDPTAVITYCDIEDAIKTRSKLNGTIKIIDGRNILSETDTSPSSRRGFRIDYLDRPTSRRFVIVRPQKKSSNKRESRSSSHNRSPASSTHDHTRSPSNDTNHEGGDDDDDDDDDKNTNVDNNSSSEQPTQENLVENLKAERRSPTPVPPSSPTPPAVAAAAPSSPSPPPPPPLATQTLPSLIKQRRSTDRSQSPVLSNPAPIAGRTFHGSLGSYLSANDTANVNNLNDLMILCEQLNASATRSNTALSTVYPVQFILKSHAYDSRLHFLAGSPTLASILLGQPGDLIAAKTELKITQRLRLTQQKFEELERIIRSSVTHALNITGNNPHTNMNGLSSNGLPSTSNRKQLNIANQTKFAILIASPKLRTADESLLSSEQQMPTIKIKNEVTSPHHLDGDDKHIEVKREKIDKNYNDDDDSDNDDESLLSRLIAYLLEKDAAGVISIPFHPTYQGDHVSRQETAVIHICPPCPLSKKLLKIICPSIHFSHDLNTSPSHPTRPATTTHDEHLMVIIVHNDSATNMYATVY